MTGVNIYITTLFVSTYFAYTTEIGIVKEYCSATVFNPVCDDGEVILINHAMHGAIKVGECMNEIFTPFIGCESDELQYFDSHCSGLKSCDVPIPVPELLYKLECLPNGLSPYLEASFSCLAVESDKRQCNSPRTTKVSTAISIISSMNSLATSCGQRNTPYILQGKPGQQINITMIDFSWRSEIKTLKQCVSYGYILDPKNDDVITICGNRDRNSHLYTSVGHSVQVMLESSILQNNRFLIEYNAFGCPDIKPPTFGWVQKEKLSVNTMKVGCYSSSKTWILQCVDDSWLGLVGNCSAPVETTTLKFKHAPRLEEKEEFIENKVNPELNITRNHVLIVTIGCLTLICCSIVIIAGIYCIKKYQKRSNKHAADSYEYGPNGPETYNTVTYKPGNHSIVTKEGVVMLPSYTMSMNKGSRVPDVPPRNPATDINYENCFMNQTNDSESVQYYVLENPEENMGNGFRQNNLNHN